MKDHLIIYSQLYCKLHALGRDPLYLNHPLRQTSFKILFVKNLLYLDFSELWTKYFFFQFQSEVSAEFLKITRNTKKYLILYTKIKN